MKKMNCAFRFSLILALIFALALPISASETELPACSVSKYEVPEQGEVILLENHSTVLRRGAVKKELVNKTYSVRIQDRAGSCTNSATISITGSYTYDSGNNAILSADLNASVSYVPPLWTVTIENQWYNVSGNNIEYSIYYRSSVDDPYSCMVGSGPWYSGATFTIR